MSSHPDLTPLLSLAAPDLLCDTRDEVPFSWGQETDGEVVVALGISSREFLGIKCSPKLIYISVYDVSEVYISWSHTHLVWPNLRDKHDIYSKSILQNHSSNKSLSKRMQTASASCFTNVDERRKHRSKQNSSCQMASQQNAAPEDPLCLRWPYWTMVDNDTSDEPLWQRTSFLPHTHGTYKCIISKSIFPEDILIFHKVMR